MQENKDINIGMFHDQLHILRSSQIKEVKQNAKIIQELINNMPKPPRVKQSDKSRVVVVKDPKTNKQKILKLYLSNKNQQAKQHQTIKQRLAIKKKEAIYRPYVDNIVEIELIVDVKSGGFHQPNDQRTTSIITVQKDFGMDLMEFLEKQTKPLELNIVKNYFYQILRGAAMLHLIGAVHRDIKPTNMIVVNYRQHIDRQCIKLIDFDIVKTFHTKSTDITVNQGTFGYMAPDIMNAQINEGQKNYYKGDAWSIGITMLLVMVAGRKTSKNNSSLKQLLKLLPSIQHKITPKNFKKKAKQLLENQLKQQQYQSCFKFIQQYLLAEDIGKRFDVFLALKLFKMSENGQSAKQILSKEYERMNKRFKYKEGICKEHDDNFKYIKYQCDLDKKIISAQYRYEKKENFWNQQEKGQDNFPQNSKSNQVLYFNSIVPSIHTFDINNKKITKKTMDQKFQATSTLFVHPSTNKFIVLGGRYGSDSQDMTTHLEYNHLSNSSKTLPRLLYGRCFATACSLYNKFYMLLGGLQISKLGDEEEDDEEQQKERNYLQKNQQNAITMVFSEDQQRWSEGPSLKQNRMGSAAVVYGQYLYMIAGTWSNYMTSNQDNQQIEYPIQSIQRVKMRRTDKGPQFGQFEFFKVNLPQFTTQYDILARENASVLPCERGFKIFGGSRPDSKANCKVIEIIVNGDGGDVQTFKDEFGYFDFWQKRPMICKGGKIYFCGAIDMENNSKFIEVAFNQDREVEYKQIEAIA